MANSISNRERLEVSPEQLQTTLLGLHKEYKEQSASHDLSLPAEAGFVLQQVTRNPKILKCLPESIKLAVLGAGQLGLTLNPVLGYAYLSPYWNKAINAHICNLMLGYRGLLKIAYSSGMVESISAAVVRNGDHFDYSLGSNPFVEHKPLTKRGDNAHPTHAYCVAMLKSGRQHVEVMDEREILDVASCAQDQSLWTGKFRLEQWRKTPIRRAFKTMPSSPVIERAEALLAQVEPFDYSRADQEADERELISDEQVGGLVERMVKAGITGEKIDRQLRRLAISEGYATICEVPADLHDALMNKLNIGLSALQGRQEAPE